MSKKKTDDETSGREEEATSSETLSEIEESESITDAGGDSDATPSPDGQFSDGAGATGTKDNPHPM